MPVSVSGDESWARHAPRGEAGTGRQIHVLHLCNSHSRLYTVFASVTAHGRRTLRGNTAAAQNRKILAQY